jgi:hypothetical protein
MSIKPAAVHAAAVQAHVQLSRSWPMTVHARGMNRTITHGIIDCYYHFTSCHLTTDSIFFVRLPYHLPAYLPRCELHQLLVRQRGNMYYIFNLIYVIFGACRSASVHRDFKHQQQDAVLFGSHRIRLGERGTRQRHERPQLNVTTGVSRHASSRPPGPGCTSPDQFCQAEGAQYSLLQVFSSALTAAGRLQPALACLALGLHGFHLAQVKWRHTSRCNPCTTVPYYRRWLPCDH